MASKPILVLTLIQPFETILKKALKANTIDQKKLHKCERRSTGRISICDLPPAD